MDHPSRFRCAAVGLLLCSCVAICSAQEYVLDQWNDGPVPTLFWNLQAMGPVFQQFTPSQEQIEFAEFWIDRQNDGPETRLSVTVWNFDRTANVGSASSIAVPPFFEGPVRVTFSPAIHLVPGRPYLLELRSEGTPQLSVGVVQNSPYLRGYVLRGEIIYGELDLWFREGTLDFTPVIDASWGSIKQTYAGHAESRAIDETEKTEIRRVDR